MEANNIVEPNLSSEMVENTFDVYYYLLNIRCNYQQFKLNLYKFYNFAEAYQLKFILEHMNSTKICEYSKYGLVSNICTGMCSLKRTNKIKVQPTSIARRAN